MTNPEAHTEPMLLTDEELVAKMLADPATQARIAWANERSLRVAADARAERAEAALEPFTKWPCMGPVDSLYEPGCECDSCTARAALAAIPQDEAT